MDQPGRFERVFVAVKLFAIVVPGCSKNFLTDVGQRAHKTVETTRNNVVSLRVWRKENAMPDGSDDGNSISATRYRAGDILLYRVTASNSASAPEVAYDLGRLAQTHGLDDWSVAPIGLGHDLAYLDLELHDDIDIFYLKLIIGLDPEVY